ncbi:ArsR family transcriptional regulator [Deinobacterium chartae]|uniref:ArsR family transcriptional regulator n=1 Tax=Deinobacterium chartae TaxID=521158 RepID=A0A841I0M8_9DEIO|nr:metalloregulator ArsR/SmtB family transcription factor [Deinobacterium chartae]MBB6099217.1 ArsR family transcriptional regulator [Deinobacterium chartae]
MEPQASPFPLPPLEVLRALADPTRLRILSYLLEAKQACQAGREWNGGSISQTLGLAQPTVSHHMKQLVGAGLVTAIKEGTTVYYSLGSEGFQEVRVYLEPFLAISATPKE